MNLPLILPLLCFIAAMALSLGVAPQIRKYALNSGKMDMPDERKVHSTPTPRLGGIGIFVAFMIAALVFFRFNAFDRALLTGGTIVFMTGLLDDLVGMSPRWKFAGLTAGTALTMILGGGTIVSLGNLVGVGEIILPVWVAIPFTLFAVVGLSNAINLIDGLDGLAGGITTIALISFMLLSYISNNLTVLIFSSTLLGAILGFLKYNLYPARMFLGDGGSLFLGYVLAFLSIRLTQGPAAIPPVIPLIILGIPILDTLWVLTRRILAKTHPFKADRTHLHHKFLDLGYQHRYTVVIIYSISWFWSIIAITFRDISEAFLFFGYIASTLVMYLLLRYALRNANKFPLLNRDSASSVRESVFFMSLANLIKKALPLLTLLLAVYPLSILTVSGQCCSRYWGISIVLLLFLTLTHLPILKQREGIKLISVHLAILFIIYAIRMDGDVVSSSNILYYKLADSLLVISAIIISLILAFITRQAAHITSLDSLILGSSILIAVFVYHLPEFKTIPGVLLRSIIFYIGYKLLLNNEKHGPLVILSGIIISLLAISLSALSVHF